MNHPYLQVAALLAGAAIIATPLAASAPAANLARGSVRPDGITNCYRSQPCIRGSNLGSGPGVEGLNQGSGNGVYSLAYNNDGVNGTTVNPSNSQRGRSGVYGADNSTDGGSGNVGVSGYSANGTGVWGTSTNGWGVLGQSASGFGVAAQSRGPYINAPAVVASDASGDEYQTVEAIGGTSGDSNGYNLATFLYDGTPSFWVDNNSDAYVNGLIYTRGGPCTYGCARGRGEQAGSYAAESSTPILEDDGESRLQSGQARIAIDASLARAIDQDSPYVVFVSPEGPSHGLYVTAKTATGFRVVENEGGRSTVAFSYRIMAKPYGVHAPRLPILTAARIPHAIPVRASKEFPR